MNYRRALEVIHQETYEVKSVPNIIQINVSNNSELLILRSSEKCCLLNHSVDNKDWGIELCFSKPDIKKTKLNIAEQATSESCFF